MNTPNTQQWWHNRVRPFLARRATHVLALIILGIWWTIVLRDQLPILLTLLAAAAAAAWMTRHHTGLAAAVAIAAATALLPAAAMLTVLQSNPAATNTAAVLIGYTLAGPIPTLATWALRPAVLHRTRTALTGSAVMLASAAFAATLAAAFAATLLPVTVIAITTGTWLSNRRRRRSLTGNPKTCQIGDGWLDLGARIIPGGLQVHRLLMGRGHGIAAWPSPTDDPSRVVLESVVLHSAALADAIGVSAARVQPVLLAPIQGLPRRHLVITEDLAAVVIVANPEQLTGLTAVASRRRRCSGRHARRVAAALPTPELRRPVMA